MTLSFVVVAFAGLSILIGITAGISISIQYYDSQLYESADYQPISSSLTSSSRNAWQNRRSLTQQSSQRPIAHSSDDDYYHIDQQRVEKSNSTDAESSKRKIAESYVLQGYHDTGNSTDQVWIIEESPLLLHKTTSVTNHTFDFPDENEQADIGSSSPYSSYANHDRTLLNFNDEQENNGKWHTYSIGNKILNDVKVPIDVRSRRPHPKPPSLNFHDWASIHPKLCSDGSTFGYDSFYMLQGAIYEANFYSAEVFVRWNDYYNSVADYMKDVNGGSSSQPYYGDTFEDNLLYYDEEIVLTLCPGISLLSKASQESNFQLVRESESSVSPFFYINAENLIIECGYGGRTGTRSRGSDGVHYTNDPNECILDLTLDSVKDVYTSHISFGPNAQNVIVRGFTFAGASTSSVAFHENEAFERISSDDFVEGEASFVPVFYAPSVSIEDCVFYNNRSVKNSGHGRNQQAKGSIIDIHSYNTIVNLYNCYTIPSPHLPANSIVASLYPKEHESKKKNDKKKKNGPVSSLAAMLSDRAPAIAIREP